MCHGLITREPQVILGHLTISSATLRNGYAAARHSQPIGARRCQHCRFRPLANQAASENYLPNGNSRPQRGKRSPSGDGSRCELYYWSPAWRSSAPIDSTTSRFCSSGHSTPANRYRHGSNGARTTARHARHSLASCTASGSSRLTIRSDSDAIESVKTAATSCLSNNHRECLGIILSRDPWYES